MNRWLATLLIASAVCRLQAAAASGDEVIPHRQDHVPNPPYSPAEARGRITVPDGFSVELVASEPDIVNPIAMTFDDRGRIWVTESVEYPRKTAGPGRDRVKLIEGVGSNGRAEKVSVFAEGLNIPTGVAVGYGGVWVLNSPDLLFLREKDGREISREIVLTGFGRTDTHELPNSLTWGPDGWLYGLNGVFNQSRIRSNNGREYNFTCAMWRVHPRTHEFQVVCEGTSNPWGIAWDSEGSAIVEACHWANDHLFHFVETGHYQRQAGAYPPFTMRLGSITDHGHQKTAYCGIASLDTDAFPAQYRSRIVVGNVHGGCLNMDRLERDGATYLAKGETDLFTANDDWCMPVSLKIGPDGCLYILDWYDRYHCSQDAARDPEGIDRLRGRLYRLRYKETRRAPQMDLAAETDDQLIARLASPNIYYRESAQRILTERLGAGKLALRQKLERAVFPEKASLELAGGTAAQRQATLHALWALIGSGSLEQSFHQKVLAHPDAAFRAWGVRAAGDFGEVPPAIREKVSALAHDSLPEVQLQVAIAARKIKNCDALAVIEDVLIHCGQDKIIPSIAWANLHPLLETDAARFVSLTTSDSKTGKMAPALAAISPLVVERILSAQQPDGRAVAQFVTCIVGKESERGKECLSVISSKFGALNEATIVQLKIGLRPVLEEIVANKSESAIFLGAKLLAARLGIAEIDPSEIRSRFVSPGQPETARLQALDALITFRDPGLLPAVAEVLASGPAHFLTRVLAELGHVDDPKLADVILRAYPKLTPDMQPLAIDLIMQREPWAKKLLDAVLANRIPKGVLHANHLRKILESDDRDALWAVEKAFGRVREERNPEREKVVGEMGAYLRNHIGDPRRGQAVFRNFCAQCHTIYGEGARVGPDITANGRTDFDQLLSNIFDPSLVIGPAYQVTTVVTTDGRNLTGLIAEDNEQRVVVRLPGEGEEMVPRSQVKYTHVSKLSMMPEGIESLLAREDLSDLFAFLALDKPPDDPSARLIPGAPVPAKSTGPPRDSRIKIESNGQLLTVSAKLPGKGEWFELAGYVMNTNSRPYLHPVRDPSGREVLTENRPADHPWQHGIFTGFHGKVNGHEYWMENDGQIRFRRLMSSENGDDQVGWRVLSELIEPSGKAVLEEEDHVTIHAPESSEAYAIDFEFVLRAKREDVSFDQNGVGGLAVRMAWDKANPRQTHLNANGDRGRAGEKKRATWCDVERPFGNEAFGIAVFDHPRNAGHPSSWRVDEQGLINPAITGLEKFSIPAGQERSFRYRLLVYKGSATREDLQRRFEMFGAAR